MPLDVRLSKTQSEIKESKDELEVVERDIAALEKKEADAKASGTWMGQSSSVAEYFGLADRQKKLKEKLHTLRQMEKDITELLGNETFNT